MKVKLVIDGKSYNVNFIENELVTEITKIFPLNTDFQRSGENEYYAKLQKDLKNNKLEDLTSKVEKNKLYYFLEWNAISIVFKDSDINPFKVCYLGDIEEDVVPQLKNSFDNVNVKLESE